MGVRVDAGVLGLLGDLVVADSTGTIVFVNEAARRLCSYSPGGWSAGR